MDRYDVVIIGAGAGAKLVWTSLAGSGLSVAVIEESLVGGDCPFLACVPSKAMLRSAQVWRTADDPEWAGLFTGRVPERAAYEETVARRERIVRGRDDTANAAGLEKTGATLIRGTARIVRPGVVDVDGTEIGYGELVLNTGSAPVRPDIPGLDEVPVWTSDEAMSSTAERPELVVVIGGGPVGCELAFLYASFGSAVTVVQRGDRLIPREEPEASKAMLSLLHDHGVDVRLNTQVVRAEAHPLGGRLTTDHGDVFDASVVIQAAGRRPRSRKVGLDALGVEPGRGGAIEVDDHCRVVGAEHVWAVGDVTGVAPFTHTAHYHGRVVAANLAGRDTRADHRAIPRAVYTRPVLAAVGHTVASAREAGIEPLTATAPVTQAVRTSIEGEPEGWLTLLAHPDTGAVIGATAWGGRAEEWISEVSLAVRAEIPVEVARDVVHPFPTFAEVLETPLWELAERR
ncbi:dihydrolipoyl dehydrogenase family protein [Streptomyces megasporus]|uniref:dihydrolipoyl dehydrogenase family protein n=1 Tax=Streptomyces megasporus TaxID=44060 RepID=UPI0004E12B79|nr:NAD(P)/FAD-dependent oxidoreductase [Streptomyces megasporus]